jgi:DNA-directed RNA polymerase beta' subunit
MIRKVPVVPAVFRPFSVAGQTFIPGDANELYRDLFVHRRLHDEAIKELGPDAAGEATTNLYAALKAVHGYGEPVNDKARARGVSGFFQQITGTSPKFGFVNRKLLSKPVDQVSRATITVNPDLGMDEVGLPREQAWTMFGSKLQRHLVLRGFSPADAAVSVRDRDQHATRALEDLVPNHPVVVARAPAWHKFNTIGAWPKLVDGSTLQLNPYITAGQGARLPKPRP